MGTEAIAPSSGTTEEEKPLAEVEPTEGGETSEGGETAEVEVVREGKSGSQPDKQRGSINLQKRFNKLTSDKRDLSEQASQAQESLRLKEEENKLLRLALDQKTEPNKPPDPADFDSGVSDPRYSEALRQFNQPAIEAAVKQSVAAIAATQVAPIDPGIERSQKKHYESADKLGAKDYEVTEDKAIDILGRENVGHIIKNSEQSHLLLYYLGKNPGEAEDIKRLIDTNPLKATLQLGRLEAELSVKPRANSEPTPDPDVGLQGGTPSAGQTNRFQKALDKARIATGESRDMSAILRIKKEAKAAGVTVS